jgi:general secretion pathway protein C
MPKDDTRILHRNIFGGGPLDVVLADPAPPVEGESSPTGPVVYDPNNPPPACSAPIRLVGAVVSPRFPAWSFAALTGSAGKAMLYRNGMVVDGFSIFGIGRDRVILQQGSSLCQLAMFGAVQTAPAAAAVEAGAEPSEAQVAEAIAAAEEGQITVAEMEQGISRISDTQFTVQRSLVDKILESQAELMRSARVIPHEENGQVVGVKLYGVRRHSLLGRLGINNGDMLRTINGFDMTSPDSALEAYARLREAQRLSVAVTRRGQPVTIDYNIQ